MTTQTHPYEYSVTPDLRIVRLDRLVEHEFNDVQRTRPLARRLEVEGLLKNPPIVSPLAEGDGHYVVLDGANRTTALGLLGYPHCLVQVVPYANPPVTLSTWHHVVTGLAVQSYMDAIFPLEGMDFHEVDLLDARAGLARRDFLAYTITKEGKVFAAQSTARTLHEENTLLNAMVDTYKDRGQLHRAATDHIDEARRLYPDVCALVIFPNYDPAEVMALARAGELLPTGLTRHLIQGRALRTNYPLSELRSDDPLEAKNERLQAWLRDKLTSKEARYYGEGTYIFDE